jgi:transposase
MSAKKHRVKLSAKQRKKLKAFSKRGKVSARKLNRVRILLLADENRPKGTMTDSQIAEILLVSEATIARIRKQFCAEGLSAAIDEKPRSGRPHQFSGEDRAKVTALACSTPPEGNGQWSLRLMADRLVTLEFVESIAYTTVRTILKKNELSPHLKSWWCISELNSQFLWRMEDILQVYQRPYDPLRPVICYDERPCQLIGDTILPLPISAGKPKRVDHHYERNGVANLLIAVEPLTGRRYVQITDRRTKREYADFLKFVVETYYKHAEQAILVQDNLNTHTPAAFYQEFSAQEAFELAQKFDMHYTPTNGSWLNMAEIEISAISRQCLNRRIPDKQTLLREVTACVNQRNEKRINIDWQFSIPKARDKFSRFYPNPS